MIGRAGLLTRLTVIACALVGLLTAGALDARAATPGPATSAYFSASNTRETIYVEGGATQELNAYVAAGDTYSATITGSTPAGTTGFAPDGTALQCVSNGAGQCTIGPIVATAANAGVWAITIPAASADLNAWSVSVTPAGQAQPERGRVWTSSYNITQEPTDPTNPANEITFGLYDVDQYGSLYHATYGGYDGVLSSIAAEGVGPVPTTSATGDSPCSEASDGSKPNEGFPQSCAPLYNEFEADPRGIGLPATAPAWNPLTASQQTVFVLPTVAKPAVSGVALDRNGRNLYSGTITANVADYSGQATVTVTDATGRTLRSFTAKVAAGANAIPFDGLDSSGRPINATPITVRVALDHEGEIHFLLGDVERFTGGIQVDALTGPNAGTANADILYWNDSALDIAATPNNPGCRPAPTVNTAGVHTAAGGVHGWSESTACGYDVAGEHSYGDTVTIDNYTYADPGVAAQATVYAPADVRIGKSASPSTIVPGTNERYTLTVTNRGPATAVDAIASDPLPSGETFVSAPGCTATGGIVSCAAGNLAVGASRTFTVTAHVASSADDCSTLQNTASVTTPSPDPNLTNNRATVCPPVKPTSGLRITKVASSASVTPGGQVTYTIAVDNAGPSNAYGVTVDDPLPAGLALVSESPSQGTCSGTSCSLGTVPNGGSAQILVAATVADTASGTLTNCATVASPGQVSGRSCATVPVVPPRPTTSQQSDLQIVKRVNHTKAYAGQLLTYTLTVSNHGPDASPDSKVTDTPSPTLHGMKAKPSQGSCRVGGELTCSLGTIANGKTVKITVTGRLDATGKDSNTATTTGGNPDPKISNNRSKVTTAVTPRLTLKKTASASTVAAGGSVTYRLTASNPGSVPVRSTKVCDALPTGLTLTSASPKATRSGSAWCWSLGTLNAHRSRTITVHVRASSSASGALTNHATATGRGVRRATASRTVRVTAPRPVLRLRKRASATSIAAGQSVTYRLTVTALKATAHHAVVCDALPLGLTFTGASPKARISSGRQCWTFGVLNPGRSRTITLHVRALRGAAGTKVNHATATARGAREVRAKAAVRVRPGPRPAPTPVTG